MLRHELENASVFAMHCRAFLLNKYWDHCTYQCRYNVASMNMESISILMVSTQYLHMLGGVDRYTRNLLVALKRFSIDVYAVNDEREIT